MSWEGNDSDSNFPWGETKMWELMMTIEFTMCPQYLWIVKLGEQQAKVFMQESFHMRSSLVVYALKPCKPIQRTTKTDTLTWYFGVAVNGVLRSPKLYTLTFESSYLLEFLGPVATCPFASLFQSTADYSNTVAIIEESAPLETDLNHGMYRYK